MNHVSSNYDRRPRAGGLDWAAIARDAAGKGADDWSVAEAMLCILLTAATSDGVVAPEEGAEMQGVIGRSRILKMLSTEQLCAADAVIAERMRANRQEAFAAACKHIPPSLRLPIFAQAIDVVMADGNLKAPESAFLNELVAQFSIGDENAKQIAEVLFVKNLC